LAFRGGRKAHYWTKNKEWIDENVKEPFDYVQLDHQQIRNDLLEWGVNTQDFWNLWRLTPSVFRENKDGEWLIKKEAKYYLAGSSDENVRYCLDKSISLIVKKRSHFDLVKSLDGAPSNELEVVTTSDPTLVYEKSTTVSAVKNELRAGLKLRVSSVVRGLDSEEIYVNVFQALEDEEILVAGYVRASDTKIADDEQP
jgi:hypothetical protein